MISLNIVEEAQREWLIKTPSSFHSTMIDPQTHTQPLKVHEWLAVSILIGIILGLASITAVNNKSIVNRAHDATVEMRNVLEIRIKGAVNYPGVYFLPANATMREVLQYAGARQEADLRRFNLDRPLRKSRIINIPERQMINIYITGAVKSPGLIKVPKGSSLKDLANLAVLAENADLSSLQKKRKLKNDEVVHVRTLADPKELPQE